MRDKKSVIFNTCKIFLVLSPLNSCLWASKQDETPPSGTPAPKVQQVDVAQKKMKHSSFNSTQRTPEAFNAQKTKSTEQLNKRIDAVLEMLKNSHDGDKPISDIVNMHIKAAKKWVETLNKYQDPTSNLRRTYQQAVKEIEAAQAILTPNKTHVKTQEHLEHLIQNVQKLSEHIPFKMENKEFLLTALDVAKQYLELAKKDIQNPLYRHLLQQTNGQLKMVKHFIKQHLRYLKNKDPQAYQKYNAFQKELNDIVKEERKVENEKTG